MAAVAGRNEQHYAPRSSSPCSNLMWQPSCRLQTGFFSKLHGCSLLWGSAGFSGAGLSRDTLQGFAATFSGIGTPGILDGLFCGFFLGVECGVSPAFVQRCSATLCWPGMLGRTLCVLVGAWPTSKSAQELSVRKGLGQRSWQTVVRVSYVERTLSRRTRHIYPEHLAVHVSCLQY